MKTVKIVKCTGEFIAGGIMEFNTVLDYLIRLKCDMVGDNSEFLANVMERGGREYFGSYCVEVN